MKSILRSKLGKGCLYVNTPTILHGPQVAHLHKSFQRKRGTSGRHACKGCIMRSGIQLAAAHKPSFAARPGVCDSYSILRKFGFHQLQPPARTSKCCASRDPSQDFNRGPPTVWELVKFYIALGLRILRQVQSPQWEQYYFPDIKEVLWKTACVLMAMITLALIMSGMDTTFLRLHQKFILKG